MSTNPLQYKGVVASQATWPGWFGECGSRTADGLRPSSLRSRTWTDRRR